MREVEGEQRVWKRFYHDRIYDYNPFCIPPPPPVSINRSSRDALRGGLIASSVETVCEVKADQPQVWQEGSFPEVQLSLRSRVTFRSLGKGLMLGFYHDLPPLPWLYPQLRVQHPIIVQLDPR